MLEAFSTAIYGPATQLSYLVGKPLDQAIYMIASLTTLFVSLMLYQIKGENKKKIFSLITGLSINLYVFGLSASASIF